MTNTNSAEPCPDGQLQYEPAIYAHCEVPKKQEQPSDCEKVLRLARLGRGKLRKLRMLKDHPTMTLHRHHSSHSSFEPGSRFIKGQSRDRLSVFASAVSYASTSFFSKLCSSYLGSSLDAAPVLAFFCGLHNREPGLCDARAIVAQFIAQLICTCHESMSRNSTVATCQERMNDVDLDEMCDLFKQLLESV